MASPNERARNNVRAGVFVLFSIVLATAAIMILTDAWGKITQPTRTYTVSFNITDGVKNLKKGSEVRVGGVLLGRVKRVEPHYSADNVLDKIIVQFTIDSEVTLYSEARIVVTGALIGADARLDIFSVGLAKDGEAEDVIKGFSGPGVLVTLLGPEGAAKTDSIVDGAAEVIENLKAASVNVRDFSDHMPTWSTSVGDIMTWATSATDKFDAVLDEGHGFITDARAVIADNRGDFDATMDNLHLASDDIKVVTAQVRDQTIQKVENLLDKGKEGLESFIAVVESIHEEWDFWAPQISDAVASARLAAQQIELTMIEVRRSPWKILYSPDRSEVAHEMLYEAARSFAMAASDLKAATASTERLLNNHASQLDEQSVLKLNEYLVEKAGNFEKAQARLLGVLLKD